MTHDGMSKTSFCAVSGVPGCLENDEPEGGGAQIDGWVEDRSTVLRIDTYVKTNKTTERGLTRFFIYYSSRDLPNWSRLFTYSYLLDEDLALTTSNFSKLHFRSCSSRTYGNPAI